MKKALKIVTGLLFALTLASAASANVLVNSGFEAGPAPSYGAGPGWTVFGNVYTESSNPPAIIPYAGSNICKMFGTFSPFGVSGIFQSYPASPGETWSLSSKSRHFSGDAMIGSGIPSGGSGNWVVQKLIFRANGVDDIASVESTILDGTFATDTWFDNAAVTMVAPPTTTTVWAFILYLQPAYDGGAAQIDDVDLHMEAPIPVQGSTWGAIKALY